MSQVELFAGTVVDTGPRERWRAERDEALETVQRNAGRVFLERATSFVVEFLQGKAAASGEEISLACKAAGIRPHDDRAFGAVYLRLCRAGQIEKCGQTRRLRGHGTAGGNLWRLRVESGE